MNTYNVLIYLNGMCSSYYISSDKNLVDLYKESKMNGEKFITWDNGVMNMEHVFGVIKES
jgi:hypothetical protein